MVVIKNNKEIPYDSNKIRRAIIQAANQIKLPNFDFIDSLTNEITTKVVMKGKNAVSNSEIENIVMSVLYDKAPDIARQYSDYKIDKERAKKNPTEIEKVLYVNDDIKYENGNKNPNLVHIKNAYLAEIPSKEMLKKLSCGEIYDVYPETAKECHDAALDMLYMPDTVTVDMSGKWPELKSFDYIADMVKQDVFGGQFKYNINEDMIPF